MEPKLEELIESHWSYVRALLEVHGASPNHIAVAEFHYKTAFEHGWKHHAKGE